MAITAQDVNKLRQMTGMGMMDCKNALTEAEGDFDKAIEILRKRGEKISAKRADNETKEGQVLVHTNEAGTEGTIIALSCETEPVSKTPDFGILAKNILDLAVANKPATTDALLALKIGDKTISDSITEMVGKIGEKLAITHFSQITAEKIIPYIHAGAKLGVLVALKGVSGVDVTAIGKDVAMQIAAMKPIAVDKDDVDPSIVEKEIEIGKEVARNEGKPEAMLDKIALGKLNKFYKDSTLLNQDFVKDGSKTVAQALKDVTANLTVTAFRRVSVN